VGLPDGEEIMMLAFVILTKYRRVTDGETNVSECLHFWQGSVHKCPRLYPLHLKHHCIPATSAAMERCFSAVIYIVNARHSTLSDQMLEDNARCKDFLN